MDHLNDPGKLLTKGMEVARRDGCSSLVKIFKNCIDIIFRTRDLTKLKNYLEHTWIKILDQHVNIKDFLIAKEVKHKKYSVQPAAIYVNDRVKDQDIMKGAKHGERIKYLVIKSTESSKIKDLVVSVEEYLQKYKYTINTKYYLNNMLNKPLSRFLNTFNIDINK